MLRKVLKTRCSIRPRHQLRSSYHEVSFATSGELIEVLEYLEVATEDDMPYPGHSPSVRVEMWETPWNPADVNTVQGKYASPYPDKSMTRELLRMSRYFQGRTVAGSEGWGRVTDICGTASHLNVGDVVTVGLPGLGTLRSSLWVPPASLIPITRGLELSTRIGPQAALLPQLGGTAIRMLRDFCHLQPGDTVIQNAGNSGVGLMVSQLARQLHGVQVVSMVRRGTKNETEWAELVQHLTQTGKAAIVVAEEDIADRDALKDFILNLQQLSMSKKLPSLALNAVGGDSSSTLLSCLDQGGTLVTYGGMSLKPVTVRTPQLIFGDIRLAGYWHSRWMVQCNDKDKQCMVDELVDTVLDKEVQCPPVNLLPLREILTGLHLDTNQTGIRKKLLLSCRER